MNNSLTVAGSYSFDQITTLAEAFAKSGMFDGARTAAQALVKIQAGRELGFAPTASMMGVHFIDGKPAVGAHLMAAMIKRSGHYDYKVISLDRSRCELAFLVRQSPTSSWEPAGPNIVYTFQEAQDSGLAVGKNGIKSNWSRTPDDMLFARCISKGYRRYYPDLSCGFLVYTTEEMSDAEPVQVQADVQTVPALPTKPVQQAITNGEAPVAKPAEERITKDQRDELANLIRETGTDGVAACKHFAIPVLEKLPDKRFDEFKAILLTKQKKQEEAKRAALPAPVPAPAPVAAAVAAQPTGPSPEQAELMRLRDEVDELANQLGYNVEPGAQRFREALQKAFNTVDLSALALKDVRDLRDRLKKKTNGQPAAAA